MPHLGLPPRALALLLGIAAMLMFACGGGDKGPEPTSTPKPIPSPVAFAPEPAQDYVRGDPAFEALPGATAHFGALGGAIYQIEMPDQWNGRLVLFMHGSRKFEPELTVDMPSIRDYLIHNGYAWAASSYSSNIPAVAGLAADETAALWDKFVQQFGHPTHTYVTGQSLGGIASVLSAERYPDRYEGALPLCGATYPDSFLDFLVAGAYVAGVTQQQFDSTPSGDIYAGIRSALADPASYAQFRSIVIDLTGGPRPLAQQGVDVDIAVFDAWTNSQLAVDTRIVENPDTVYELAAASGVSSAEFNQKAIRVSRGPLYDTFNIQPTGDIKIPVLTLNTTGETRIPIEAVRDLQRKVAAANRDDLLVQRTVRDPYHCGFTNLEWEQGLEDLIAWVEKGTKPKGEDVLNVKASDLGKKFTLAPRIGLPEADRAPGADKRLTVRGTATLDGRPVDAATLAATVRGPDGLSRSCALDLAPIRNGRYELLLAADEEMDGCGAPGAQLFAILRLDGQTYISQELATWPDAAKELTFDPTFSSTNAGGVGRAGTFFYGTVLDSHGVTLPPGTLIEAFIGQVRCGISSLPYIVTASGDPASYSFAVVSPDAIAGCQTGRAVSFRVDGTPVPQTATHDLSNHALTLTLP